VTDLRVVAGDSLRAAARTHPGRVRTNNEDLPLIDAARGIFGVIDGIGGHAGGEIAAATARDVVLQRLARPLGTPAERVREAIAIANNEIHRRAQESRELGGMACVMTLALVADGRLTIGHVGDTRLYEITRDGLRKLTRDHSPVGEREDAGELSEVDAMRHPRRHEVFRDVGSVYRDKDEEEFVDVVEQPLERDSALLICSDGLTDMLPASAVAHIVRQHAGDPERVVEALVGAANDAGGRDNVTVVYAEMPRFAGAAGRSEAETAETSEMPELPESPDTAGPLETVEGRRGIRWAARAIAGSRATWFFVGTFIGVVGALALMFYVAETQVRGPQTLVVGTEGTARFSRIMDAVSVARPGDVVRLEPGIYEEIVVLGSGVDLVAREPYSVTIRRPATVDGSTAPLTIAGALNARISGIRIDTPADRPADAAVRIAGPAVTLELIEITGPFRQAFALSPSSAMTLHGGRVATGGSLILVPDDGQVTIVNSVFTRAGAATDPPVTVSPTGRLVMRGNVLSGYGADVVKGLADARRREVLDGNLIVPGIQPRGAAPAASRGRGGRGR
jgi:serine/threonine protein phosphatase PrpC